MKIAIARAALAAVLAAGLAGCAGDDGTAAIPSPVALDRDAIGHYCAMTIADHAGPKGQIHLRGQSRPYWFSSVRDTLAFTLLPDEPKNIAAIYVNDMGRASWQSPEPGTWIEARDAWFVVGSNKRGGMGAPETVPFAEHAAADAFVAEHGGEVMRLTQVPADAVLGPVAAQPPDAVGDSTHGHGMAAQLTKSHAGQMDGHTHGARQ